MSNCRTMRQRPAPSATRTAISFCRAAARASNRLATFAQAISKHEADRAQQHQQRPPLASHDSSHKTSAP